MSSYSVKDITKSLSQLFASVPDLPCLPEAQTSSILACIEKTPVIDENSSQRLQDDLTTIYTKSVDAEDTKNRGAFLQALNLLKPYLNGQEKKLEWWRVAVKPVLDSPGCRRVEVEAASDFVLGILVYDADDDPNGSRAKESSLFTKLIMEAYLKRSTFAKPDAEGYAPKNEQVSAQLEHVLVTFGRRKTKAMLIALDKLVVNVAHRPQALGLLSVLVRHQPPHLYEASQTPLIEHLIQCLMIDTSVTVIQLALTSLIMFLPHVPSSIRVHLPRLFLIYSRLLCWDQSEVSQVEDSSDVPAEPEKSNEGEKVDQSRQAQWEKLDAADGERKMPPELSYFFTFLYGLYPLNFSSYIRKPRRYLKDIGFPRAEQLDLDQDLIKSRTEAFRETHMLHANFYNTVLEDELADDRWLKTDAADVVAECISLRLSGPAILERPGPPPNVALPRIPASQVPTDKIPPQSLLEAEDNASAMSEGEALRSDGSAGFETTEDQQIGSSLTRICSSPRTRASGVRTPSGSPARHLPKAAGDSPTLPATAPKEHAGESSSTMLQRQLILLRNDLNFERYLKQQHLAHIGQLQRRHINDATLAANTENLINLNKSLQTKLTKANDTYSSLKKETATGRTQSKKFESELSSRVRTLREAERAWQAEEETLRVELRKAHKDCDALRQLVVESESRELLGRQKIASTTLELEEVESLRDRIRELEDKLEGFRARETALKRSADDRETLRLDLATATLQLQSHESVIERTRKGYEKRIAELEGRLAEKSDPERSAETQELIQKAVSAANTRYSLLKKEYAALRHKHVELELRCDELESVASEPGKQRSRALPSHPASRFTMGDDEGTHDNSGLASSPNSGKSVGQSSLSRSTSSAVKRAPPLPAGGSPASHRPGLNRTNSNLSTGAGNTSGFDSDTGSGIYQQSKSAFSMESLNSDKTTDSGKGRVGAKSTVRVFGRGGTQNIGKNESEDEERPRPKRKGPVKTGGIRGLRGLM